MSEIVSTREALAIERASVRALIEARSDETMTSLLRGAARDMPNNPFAIFPELGELTMTYRDLADGAAKVNTFVVAQGISPGARVALYLPNSPAYIWAWFGLLHSSRVDVNISPEQVGHGLAYMLNKSQAEMVITDRRGLERLRDLEGLDISPVIAIIEDPDPKNVVLDIEAVRPAGPPLAGAESPAAEEPADDNPFGLASIRFTSGSTGLPKGVMLSQAHMIASARMFCHLTGYSTGEALYTCFPAYHVHGSVTGILAVLVARGTLIMSSRFSASRYWRHIRDYNVKVAHILEAPANILMSLPPSELDREHSCRILYAMTESPAFEERFGVNGISLFDMSELTVAAYYPPGVPHRHGSQGLPSPLFDVVIVDDDDRQVPAGTQGEIVVRPTLPHIMTLGYFRDDELTVKAFRNLWFHTGDRGYLDDDGFLFFIGRVGDRIRRRGVNVSAVEIEAAALRHGSIAEAAAIGVPSPFGEDDIKISVTLKSESSLDNQQLFEYLAATLARSSTPRYIEIRDEFPRTQGTEKIRKAALRTEGDHGITATSWDSETRKFAQPPAVAGQQNERKRN